jgi:hypothetical protein
MQFSDHGKHPVDGCGGLNLNQRRRLIGSQPTQSAYHHIHTTAGIELSAQNFAGSL